MPRLKTASLSCCLYLVQGAKNEGRAGQGRVRDRPFICNSLEALFKNYIGVTRSRLPCVWYLYGDVM